ncbi:segregation and condensation protein A [Spiroplasma helicoides]|uniref:Segregation and condensation protein A n=1 Tax=Spiroplasma helicoides TaxID=216938 RepID=A0A1B3SJT4_9MOLU|nr:segregation/condensation protein A [Spiroplasma helicoides]AOG60196.1 segregation and condensation protein A [Spiroplasma helicoides]
MKERWREVQLDNFTGPLDLLLHMIKEKQVSIMEVNLIDLSNQYLDYIKQVVEDDIEIASEYLVMATTLLEIKSRTLIPKEEVEIDSNYEAEQREELLTRLIEYHKIKEVTEFFKIQQLEGLKVYSKPKTVIKITKVDDDKLPLAPNTIDIDKFSKIFLKAIEKAKFNNIETNILTTEEVSPEEIAKDIKEFLSLRKIEIIKLEELIQQKDYSLRMLVATFLAVLELASKKFISVYQENDDVMVKYLEKGE